MAPVSYTHLDVYKRQARGQRVLAAALDADAETSAALAPLPRLDVTLGDQAAVQQLSLIHI